MADETKKVEGAEKAAEPSESGKNKKKNKNKKRNKAKNKGRQAAKAPENTKVNPVEQPVESEKEIQPVQETEQTKIAQPAEATEKITTEVIPPAVAEEKKAVQATVVEKEIVEHISEIKPVVEQVPVAKPEKSVQIEPIAEEKPPKVKKESKKESTLGVKEPSKPPRTTKIVVGAVVGVLIVFALVLSVGAFQYKDTFLPNTQINGVDVSGVTTVGAKQILEQKGNEQQLTIIHLDSKKASFTEEESKKISLGESSEEELIRYEVAGSKEATLSVSDFDYKETVAADLEEIKNSRSSFAWLLSLIKGKEYTISMDRSYNEDKLRQAVDSLECVAGDQIVSPADAYVGKTPEGYHVIDEVEGNTVDTEILFETIKVGLDQGEYNFNLEEMGVYLKPELRAEELRSDEVLAQINQVVNTKIAYDFDFITEEIPLETIKSWIDVDVDGKGFEINRDKVKDYVVSLAVKYDTLRTNRSFHTTYGNDITIGGGIYGWQMNIPNTVDILVEKLKNLEDGVIAPQYVTYGYQKRGPGNEDIGNTYIEIDLNKQMMWMYKDGVQIIETPIVSGLPNGERDTPTGVFELWSKETKRYISGEDYKLWVEYWLPINWSGIGIHDASWQSSFGGSRYLVYGSHGCLNTPYEKVAAIYDNAEVGTPVIVHQ